MSDKETTKTGGALTFSGSAELTSFIKLTHLLRERRELDLSENNADRFNQIETLHKDFTVIINLWVHNSELRNMYEAKGCGLQDFLETNFS